MVAKSQMEYIKLKKPADVIAYVQRLINTIRRSGKEMESLGNITNLLNAWTSAFKTDMEFTEIKELRAKVEQLEAEAKAR